jgi:hypothetical protein
MAQVRAVLTMNHEGAPRPRAAHSTVWKTVWASNQTVFKSSSLTVEFTYEKNGKKSFIFSLLLYFGPSLVILFSSC